MAAWLPFSDQAIASAIYMIGVFVAVRGMSGKNSGCEGRSSGRGSGPLRTFMSRPTGVHWFVISLKHVAPSVHRVLAQKTCAKIGAPMREDQPRCKLLLVLVVF